MKLIKGLAIIAALSGIITLTACPNAAKTAADAAAGVECVTKDWGKPVAQIATDCFNDELQLAIDAVADAEFLLQSKGGAPTPAYLADARVTQIVLAKKAAAGIK